MSRTNARRRLGALAALFAIVLILTAISQGLATPDSLKVTTSFEYDEDGWRMTVNFFGEVYTVDSKDLEPIEDPGGEDPGGEDPGDEKPEHYVTRKSGKLLPGTAYETTYYVIESNKPGPTVFVVGGMHGNEPAGYLAADQVANHRISSGKLIVLPRANVRAIQQNRRYASGDPDLNRSFPQAVNETPDTPLATAIWDLLKAHKPKFVFDMHEGVDYYKAGTGSVGQTVIYHPNSEAQATATAMVNAMNAQIQEPIREFTLLRYPVKGGLTRASADYLDAYSMELETSMKQTLNTRINLHLKMLGVALDRLGMTPSDDIPILDEDEYRGPWPRKLAEGTPYETQMYKIEGSEPGPAVLVVGGLRGAEPSGVQVATELLNYTIERGTLYVLPQANRQAVEAGKKYTESGDLNRQFPDSAGAPAASELAQAIYDAVDDLNIEWVVDLHEESGYRSASASAEGNSIISHPQPAAGYVAQLLCQFLNKDIASASQKFVPLASPVKTGLVRSTADTLGTNSFTCRPRPDSPTRRPMHVCVDYLLAPRCETSRQRRSCLLQALSATPMIVIRSAVPGPTLMVVGGVRGNDPSGPAAADVAAGFRVDAGTLIVLPRANAKAVRAGVAFVNPDGDLNRQFPASSTDTPKGVLASAIFDALKKHNVDWLLDMQEAAGYRSTTAGSLGNTLIHVAGDVTTPMVDSLAAKLNTGLPQNQRFVALVGPVTSGLVRSSQDVLGVNSIYLSTSTSDKLESRTALNLTAISHMMELLGLRTK